jgi:hypothetical protein
MLPRRPSLPPAGSSPATSWRLGGALIQGLAVALEAAAWRASTSRESPQVTANERSQHREDESKYPAQAKTHADPKGISKT